MRFVLLLLAGVMYLVLPAGLPAAEVPEEILNIAPLYPEAKILAGERAAQVTRVRFETDATLKEVFEFYKKEMTERGWRIVHEKASDNETRLVMTKDDLQFGFGSHAVPERKTAFFLSVKQPLPKSGGATR